MSTLDTWPTDFVRRPNREVKESFVFVERLKKGPFDTDGWVAALARHRSDIATLDDVALDACITFDPRLQQLTHATWYLGEVELANCNVWNGMGDLPASWARGTAENVANEIRRRGPSNEKVGPIGARVAATLNELPLIAHRRTKPGHYRIDDGCNRAVAYLLADVRVAPAFIGIVPKRLQYTW